MKVYKIRNKEGLFSTGGLYPQWRKVGKTWVTLSHIRAHLTMLRNQYKVWNGMEYCTDIQYPYIGCTVIEYIVIENATALITAEGNGQLEYVDGGPKQ
jgi:hypothetical protein